MWGVFEVDGCIRHVVPVGQSLEVSPPHVLEWWCSCDPEIEHYEDGVEVIIHNQEN
jgi:hypothetical protein